ncbi:MAG: matrixin family metalloprotease [Bryobacterales bacterium]|nr:matrixin family metalloprotease [Bryobacterales bacterium]
MRVVFVWVLLAGMVNGAEPRLWLKSSSSQKDPALASSSSPLKRRKAGTYHLLVQFENKPGPAGIAELRNRGIRVLSHVPENGFVVSVDDFADFEGLPIKWTTLPRPSQKMSRYLVADNPRRTLHVVEFHPDVSESDQRGILVDESLSIVERPGLLAGHLLVEADSEEVTRLAQWDEVAYVFPAPEEMADGRPMMACAGALSNFGFIAQYVARSSEGWDGPGQNPALLRYTFSSPLPDLPAEAVKLEILRAMAEWSRVVRIDFLPGEHSGASGNVDIVFAREEHGDGFPFDGRGKVLAHTFYPAPPNPEPIAGDMHLDADEFWNIDADVDVYSVVLHELGHALGLGHSDKPGTVMYPYYRRVKELTTEDILAIQELYAARTHEEAPPEIPLPVPTPQTPVDKPTGTIPAAPETPQPPSDPVTDNTAPTLRIISPSRTAVLTSDDTIVFRGTAYDENGVAEVTWTSSSGDWGSATGTAYWNTGPIPLLTGSNQIILHAKDYAGNTAWRSVTVTRR